MKTSLKILFKITVAVSIIVISSCTTLTGDIEIETYTENNIDLSAYKTYAWAGSSQIIYDPVGQWKQPTLDTDEEVRFVVNRELRNRGINQTTEHPDLLVAFAAGINTTVLELKENPEHDSELQNVPKAALTIALVDANTGYIIWFGYAEGDAQQQRNIEDIRARIDYAVSEIFKAFNE